MKKVLAFALVAMLSTTAFGSSIELWQAGSGKTINDITLDEGVGAQIEVEVWLDSNPQDAEYQGISVFLQDVAYDGTYTAMRVSARTLGAGAGYVSDPTTVDKFLFPGKAAYNPDLGALNTMTGDLGYTTSYPGYGAGAAGGMIVQTLTIDIAADMPAGDYFIDPTPSSWTDMAIQGHFPDSVHMFGVHIVPEPASLALLAIGGLAMMRRRR